MNNDIRAGALERLSWLDTALSSQGCTSLVENADAPVPRLWVRGRRVDERIYAAPAGETWWYWWAWAERILPCHDVATAAERIAAMVRTEA